MKEITLKELLETTFTINEKGEMIGEFTLKRINMIGDILTNQYKEIERLKKNEKFFADCITNTLNYIYELKSNCDDPALDKIINKLKGSE